MKNILIFLFVCTALFVSTFSYGQIQTVETTDNLNVGRVKINSNFTYLDFGSAFSISTASSTITLTLFSEPQNIMYGSASFSTPKTIALSGTTNAANFTFQFTITNVAAVLTMPADFEMADATKWDGTDWTPEFTGSYIMAGVLINSIWYVNINGPYN